MVREMGLSRGLTNSPPDCWLHRCEHRCRPVQVTSPNAHTKKDRPQSGLSFLVREMGLEPTRLRLDTGTSSLPVCLFQHSRMAFSERLIII